MAITDAHDKEIIFKITEKKFGAQSLAIKLAALISVWMAFTGEPLCPK